MHILIKSAVATGLALGASGAFALGVPADNSSDLILVVANATTHAAYALDTDISINSILPTSGFVSGASLNSTAFAGINDYVAASPTLASFLASNPASGDEWTLEAGQYNGAGNTATNGVLKPAGGGKAIFTSQVGTTNPQTVTNQDVQNLESFLNGYNQDVISGGALNSLTGTETASATYGSGTSAEEKYGFFTANDAGALGSSALTLFGFTGNGGTGVLQSYVLGTASVDSSGDLTITANATNTPPPVPLPAAVWLFGSGLMGLVGVSRRRKTAAAAA